MVQKSYIVYLVCQLELFVNGSFFFHIAFEATSGPQCSVGENAVNNGGHRVLLFGVGGGSG